MTTLALILTLFTLNLKAPSERTLAIVKSEATEPFKQLIYAIGKVECDFDTLAYNPLEEAAGYFQIRPIRIKHYNKLTGENMTIEDMYDYQKAERVFLYFANQIGPYDLEKVAKNWNGSGKMTEIYWHKVKKHLHNSN